MNFDEMVKNLAIHVREQLKQVEDISSINFSVDISGRAHDGELKIKYEIGSTYQDGGCVKGPKLDIVIEEYLRRFGWDKRNQPLELTFAPEPVETDITGDRI